MRLDQRREPIPRHHSVHLRQKWLASRDLLYRIAQAGKGRFVLASAKLLANVTEIYQIKLKIVGFLDVP